MTNYILNNFEIVSIPILNIDSHNFIVEYYNANSKPAFFRKNRKVDNEILLEICGE
jgi:hypothetical protein